MKLFNTKMLICVLLIFIVAVPTAMAGKRYGGFISVSAKQTDAHMRNFNPFNVETGRYQAKEWMYEPLYIFNVMHPGKDFPWLATKYEISKKMDSLTVTLRQNVKWSDGETFDADDVIFTANMKKRYPGLSEFPELWGDSGICSSIEKLGAYSVKFNYKKPNSLAHLRILTMYVVPEHIWKDVKDPIHFTNPNPVGTGPFTEVLEFKKTVFTIGKNKNYWQKGKPYIDGMRWPQYSSNEQTMAAAAKGKLDWFSDFMENPKKELTGKNKFMKHWFPPDNMTHLQLNTTKKPFSNLEFRKAMSLAINRQDLIDIATFGITSPAPYPCGIGPFYSSWLDSKRLEKYKYLMNYDAQAAKKVLDKAGFVDQNNDGWRDNPDGSKIRFKVSCPAGWTDWVNSIQIITENLQDVGINARMHTPDEGAWFDKIPRGDFDVYMMWNQVYTTPWQTYLDILSPGRMVENGISGQALHQMRLPKALEYLDTFTQVTDINKQKELMGKVEEEFAKNIPTLGLFASAAFFEYNTERFEGWANEDNPFIRPMIWHEIPERLVHVLNLSLKPGASPK